MSNAEHIRKHFEGDRAIYKMRVYLMKKQPDYVKEFLRNVAEISERQQAFWLERESEKK
jgi:hypothetical protein